MRKLVMAATAIAVMTGVATAENARTQSLVNSPLFKDRTDVMENPAWSAEYRQFIEIDYTNSDGTPTFGTDYDTTFNGSGDIASIDTINYYDIEDTTDVAHLLGVMPIGDALSIGGYISGSKTSYQPHLILGFKLGDVKLGLEGYYEKEKEKSNSSSSTEVNNTGTTPSKTVTESSSEYIGKQLELGFNLGAIIPLGDAELEVLAGFGGSPWRVDNTTSAKSTTTGATDAHESLEVETTRGTVGAINYIGGAQVRVPHNDNEFLVGLGVAGDRYEYETSNDTTKYEYKSSVNDDESYTVSAELSNVATNFAVGANLGYKFNFDKGFSFAIADEFSWNQYKIAEITGMDTLTDIDTKIDEQKEIALNHYFTIAGEKEFGKSRLFDKHFFRIGLGYEVNTAIERDSVETVDTSIDDVKTTSKDGNRDRYATDFTALNGSAGFGFERGRFQFDLVIGDVNFDWSDDQAGIFNLFGFAGATATIDFGKEGSVLRRNDPEWDM